MPCVIGKRRRQPSTSSSSDNQSPSKRRICPIPRPSTKSKSHARSDERENGKAKAKGKFCAKAAPTPLSLGSRIVSQPSSTSTGIGSGIANGNGNGKARAGINNVRSETFQQWRATKHQARITSNSSLDYSRTGGGGGDDDEMGSETELSDVEMDLVRYRDNDNCNSTEDGGEQIEIDLILSPTSPMSPSPSPRRSRGYGRSVQVPGSSSPDHKRARIDPLAFVNQDRKMREKSHDEKRSLAPSKSIATVITKLQGLETGYWSSTMSIDEKYPLTYSQQLLHHPRHLQHEAESDSDENMSDVEAVIPSASFADSPKRSRTLHRRALHLHDARRVRASGSAGTSHLSRRSPSSLLPLREKRISRHLSTVAEARQAKIDRNHRRVCVREWNLRMLQLGRIVPWDFVKWQEENMDWLRIKVEEADTSVKREPESGLMRGREILVEVEYDVDMLDNTLVEELVAIPSPTLALHTSSAPPPPFHGPTKRSVSPIPELCPEAIVSARWARRNQLRFDAEVQPYLDALEKHHDDLFTAAIRAAARTEWLARRDQDAVEEARRQVELARQRALVQEQEREAERRLREVPAYQSPVSVTTTTTRTSVVAPQPRRLLSPIRILGDEDETEIDTDIQDEREFMAPLPIYHRALWSERSPPPPPPYNARTDREMLVAPLTLDDEEDEVEQISLLARARPLSMARPSSASSSRRHESREIVGAYPSRAPPAVMTTTAAATRQPARSMPVDAPIIHRSFDVALQLEEGVDDEDENWIDGAVGGGDGDGDDANEYVHEGAQAEREGENASGLVSSVGRWLHSWF